MIKHEKSIRYKFLACLLAVTLVFGLSALPAFAVPDASSGEQPSAQSEKAAGEEKTLIENPTKEKPAIEKPASENTPKAPSDNSWTAGMTGDGATEDGSAKDPSLQVLLKRSVRYSRLKASWHSKTLPASGFNQTMIATLIDPTIRTINIRLRSKNVILALIAPPLGTTAN